MAELRTYQIRVQGGISERWTHWFEDMTLETRGDGGQVTTSLTGAVADQAALLGLLQKLYTLSLPLLLVRQEEVTDKDKLQED